MRLVLLACLAVILVTSAPADANVLVVDTPVYDDRVNGKCSLPEAIVNANADDQSGSPDCPAGFLDDLIRFSVDGVVDAAELPDNDGALSIDGGGRVTLSGNDRGPILANSGDLTLRGLTLRDGFGLYRAGAVFNTGSLRVEDSRFLDNSYDNFGTLPFFRPAGAIDNIGELTILRSVFRGNHGQTAGAVQSLSAPAATHPITLTIVDSVFEDNDADFLGAGAVVTQRSENHIRRSLFTGNSSTFERGAGALFFAESPTEITNTTITGNTGQGNAGGILSDGAPLTLRNSTLAANVAPQGTSQMEVGHSLTIANTIVDGGNTRPNCIVRSGTAVTDQGGNVEGNDGETTAASACGITAASGSQVNVDPRLDPAGLQDNGGWTETIALCTDAGVPAGCTGRSPAVDFGVPAVCGAPALAGVDQRAYSRGYGTSCDSGAFEASRDRFSFDLLEDTVDERAGTATIAVVRSPGASAQASVEYARLAAASTATPGADFEAVTGTLTFAPGERRKTFTVPILADAIDEPGETFRYELRNVQGSYLGTEVQTEITILDDEATPVLSVSDAEAEEGGVIAFDVSLSGPSAATVTAGFDTQPGTAAESADYEPRAGGLTFAPGETTKTLTVQSTQDRSDEADETFSLRLANPQNAVVPDGTATGTIRDDDTRGVVVTLPPDGVVTTEGGGTAGFAIRLSSQPSQTVTIPVAAFDASEAVAAPPVVTFTPQTFDAPQMITVTGLDDSEDDGDVAHSIQLGAASSNDQAYAGLDPEDVPTLNLDDDGPAISVADVTASEGDPLAFEVALGQASPQTVTVRYDTADGSAAAPADYEARGGTLSFAPGETEQTVTVPTVEDRRDEADETLSLRLSNPQNATAPDDTAQGTIADDDTAGVAVVPTTGLTTTEAGGTATFTVALASEPGADVAVALSSSDATEGTVAPSVLTFSPQDFETPQTVTVTGVDDAADDGDVTYQAVLGAVTSADAAYDGLDPADIALTNIDDDGPAPTATPTATATATATAEPTPTATPTPPPARPLRCTMRGTNRPELIRGTKGRDVICGMGGADTLRGLGGNDVLRGGRGGDDLFGGRGLDKLRGGPGKDRLVQGPR